MRTDAMVDAAGTLPAGARSLKKGGATNVDACATPGILNQLVNSG